MPVVPIHGKFRCTPERLAELLRTGARIIVYPVGLDRDDRIVADVMLGGADLAERLRAR